MIWEELMRGTIQNFPTVLLACEKANIFLCEVASSMLKKHAVHSPVTSFAGIPRGHSQGEVVLGTEDGSVVNLSLSSIIGEGKALCT